MCNKFLPLVFTSKMGGDNIQIEPLDVDNYGTWSVRMRMLLTHKGLWPAVAGTATSSGATTSSATSGDDKATTKATTTTDKSNVDEKALTLIGLNVKDHHLPTLQDCKSAKEAWEALESIYKAKSNARKLQLRSQLNHLRKDPAEPLTKYFARAKGLWQDLAAAGLAMPAQELVWSILYGLPDDYRTAVEILEASGGDLKLEDVMARLLLVEERQRRSDDSDTKALIARSSGRRFQGRQQGFGASSSNSSGFGSKPFNSHGGGSSGGAYVHAGSKPRPGARETRECHYCHKVGHLKRDCRKLAADQRRQQGGGGGAVALMAAATTTSRAGEDVWTIDTGANHHITPYKHLLMDIRSLESPVTVTFGNDTTTVANSIGTVVFNTYLSCGVKRTVRLKDVLYAPGASCGNLLSIKQATAAGDKQAVFGNASCSIMCDNGRIVIEGSSSSSTGGLYQVRVHYVPAALTKGMAATALLTTASLPETAELWHRRLGHAGYGALAKLQQHNMVSGINVTAESFTAAQAGSGCEPCIMAKQHRLPFSPSTSTSTAPMQLVHMDVCGPFAVESMGGNRFLATFKDDYSGLAAVKSVAHKSDVPSAVEETLKTMSRVSGHPVKTVRTDNGGEYVAKRLGAYFTENGIVHEKTAPYTPQQNGVAERLNRTMLERVRAMLQDCGLKQHLWAEAASTFCYTHNCTLVGDRDKTPLELFTGRRPNVGHMRVFGSTAYVLVPKALRKSKLDPVSKKGVMIGYQPNSKAYRVLLDSGKNCDQQGCAV